ncbi:MAG: hypothetical protein JXR91_07535 [Deltaproteobacteria bacterium]|nr:hypothetical protein [Deltaproteobacteria bacterium]
MNKFTLILLGLLGLIIIACSDASSIDKNDSGIMTDSDTIKDTATITGSDSNTGTDSAIDTGSDSAIDTGSDSAIDTGSDSAIDTGSDSAIDTGSDSDSDTETDSSVVSCWGQEGCAKSQYCNFGNCLAETGVCEDVPTMCPLNMDPVCGCDNVTYSNSCAAAVSRMTVDHKGACEADVCSTLNKQGCCSTDCPCTEKGQTCALAAYDGSSQTGVCKSSLIDGCWSVADCNDGQMGQMCVGASVCGCGDNCFLPDTEGSCLAASAGACDSSVDFNSCNKGYDCYPMGKTRGDICLHLLEGIQCWSDDDCKSGTTCQNVQLCGSNEKCLSTPGQCLIK